MNKPFHGCDARGTACRRKPNPADLLGLLVFASDEAACDTTLYQRAGLPLELGWRLAGLVDGEGYFGVYPRDRGYACEFGIGLRADDGELLRRLCAEIGGSISRRASRPRDGRANNPSDFWRVTSKGECRRLVDIFDAFPLWSKKAAEYALWREAVLYWETLNSNHGRRRFGETVEWRPMAEFCAQLKAQRIYRGAA